MQTPKKPTAGPGRHLRLRKDIPHWLFTSAGVVFPALLLLMWWLVTEFGLVKPLFLPGPGDVLAEGVRQAREGILWADASVSIYRICAGWLAATVLAVPVGILMGNFRLIEGALEPFVSTIRYMPVVALIPLTILWAGIGDGQKILILFLGTFFQQVLMVMDNVKTIDMNLIRAGQTLGFSNREILIRIILPAAAPGIWDTLRITIGWTWTYLVVAELVAANEGLGRRIMDAQRYLATETILFGTLFIGFLGFLTDVVFKRTGRVLFAWHQQRTR
ncbi:ABC transporter permease [Rhodobacter capsulatus]|jgi:NitT/TauT family transport system permease protein|uniref:ABC transporter, permease protein n=1 Tax=Rhodobacter capsulatus (strain ATCC BAA-309 / NBRC 16581 / SB1003) TaxID=272942 RepID=D5AT42_RHOCB|nr:ABC transporter permease [Rhodobacter capsulatus]ADE85149.1 ABC transporter, permease protein [Rhodobacter capsulatus SB 1003]ETD02155.1 ABC transporter permease [Rhodobacter capsulatus DE442]ETD75918.1 ABC transporter permease [Rhodobacter capsulatus B6]ETD77829.1 ABC transporter permease [Rhodobacter capsulatus R121]ETD85549.1 ABC transporter permease [Rhodobacter capsulatus YW1]